MRLTKYKILPIGWIGKANKISQKICLTVSQMPQTKYKIILLSWYGLAKEISKKFPQQLAKSA